MASTRVAVRATRTPARETSIGNRGSDQIRRMVLAPSKDRGGGALDGLGTCPASPEESGRLSDTNTCDETEGKPVDTARPGGIAILEDCHWQQGWATIIAESQSIIIARQHLWQGAGARQANAGAAAHRATTASIKIAPFLPIRSV